METQLTPLEAWEHFYTTVKPGIWKHLDNRQRNEIIIAQRDALGLRRDARTGKTVSLGVNRIARILARYAPTIYKVQTSTFFEVTNPILRV